MEDAKESSPPRVNGVMTEMLSEIYGIGVMKRPIWATHRFEPGARELFSCRYSKEF